MAVPQRFSFFLTPCADDLVWIEASMAKLGRDTGAVPFEPHVTVYSGSYDDPDLVAAAAAGAVQGVSPICLPIRGIRYSAEYFKSVFIEFSDNGLVYDIHDRLIERLGTDSGYRLSPHLSLLYHDMPVEEKVALAHSVVLDRQAVLFDRVKVVAPNNPTEGWRDIAGWRTLWCTGLTGGNRCGQ